MLVPYGYFEIERRAFQELYDALSTSHCIYRASELMNALSYSDYAKFEAVIIQAENICMSLRIPVSIHFKSIYISSPNGIYHDYRLSRFACYVITVNADSSYPAVAKAKLLLAMRGNR
ncbi:MAG: hypothetical protein JW902_12670 [Syntrophaceae bacterium]|nr:hypothetical protein [Syntrophaceae bacterium]